MAVELPRPGVEVLQKFRSVSPTVITPTLPPCVVGVCRQVVEVLTTTSGGSSALNADALVSLPALLVAAEAGGSPPAYGGLDGLPLGLSFDEGPDVVTTFVGDVLSPAQVAAQVQAALSANGVTAFVAEPVGPTRWRLRSLAAGPYATIRVVAAGSGASDPVVLSAFGFGHERIATGAAGYDQRRQTIAQASFPDPNRNLAELGIESKSIRVFLFLGGSGSQLRELYRTQAFLRQGFAGAAKVTGTADLSAATWNNINGKSVTLTLGSQTGVTVPITGASSPSHVVNQFNNVIGPDYVASLNASNHLVLTSAAGGPDKVITVTGVSASGIDTALGIAIGTTARGTAGVQTVALGNSAAITPLVRMVGQDFTASATAAAITGTAVVSSVPDGQTLTLDDGSGEQTLAFASANSTSAILTQVNALFGPAVGGSVTATLNGSDHLVLTHNKTGHVSVLKVVGGTALSALGLTTGTVARGNPFPPRAGDLLYVDGSLLATVTQVAPGGQVDQLKLDRQVPLNDNLGSSFYLVASGLAAGMNGRPEPELVVDLEGNVQLPPELLRDVQGTPVAPASARLYLAYRAVRRDVSPLAKNPGLVRFNDTVQLASQLAPVTADNPLALGLYFASVNAPTVQVTGLGIDAVSGDAPDGTLEAYVRAATFLEGYEVYAIAPLTHDSAVAQVFSTHVAAMSQPESKGERIVIFNPEVPTHKLDTLVGSGTDGNTTQSSGVFDTGIANLGALLLAQGLSPVGALAVSAGVYLDIGDGQHYSITAISGSRVTVKTANFAAGENDDGYFAAIDLPAPLISQVFAVRIRGAALELTDGTPDKDAIATTMQQLAQTYLNRRYWQTFPDKCAATVGGVETVLEGYYLSAAVAGMIAGQPPQQSFTNFPMTGFTRVLGSSDRFSEKQLNRMAAGGNYIIVQDAPATPLLCRMALTTDMTSIEARTDSVNKVVDFTAKFVRQGLKNFIGRFNISQGFLDSLGHVLEGLLSYLVEHNILISYNLNNIVQDEANPDGVLIDILLDVPYPCNYIRLTLTI